MQSVISDKDEPAVMFALQWCEFCWSVRRMFDACGIRYRWVDLDSVAFQQDGWGGRIRAALRMRVNAPTIPQIFVGGQWIGGCTETFDVWRSEKFQTLLEKSGVPFRKTAVDHIPSSQNGCTRARLSSQHYGDAGNAGVSVASSA